MSGAVNRRDFLKTAGAGAALAATSGWWTGCGLSPQKPNIIYILADDLGYGELGCYGQQKIKTPHIDRLAADGMRFTQHYSGSPVCAPSRCTLLTGLHTGHSYIRDNDEMNHRGDVWKDRSIEGQRPLLAGTTTVGTVLQKAGYKTACIGKWGLGGPTDGGHPNLQGFDLFYGYLCQREAHNYYPDHLWRNKEKVMLDNEYLHPHEKLASDSDPNDAASYARYKGNDYAPDLMEKEALDFIRSNIENPFFLYLPSPVPHVSIQVPAVALSEYHGKFDDKPYKGEKGYLPHQHPLSAYAAMITHLDRTVGRIMSLLKELGLDENTMVMFSSDNGATFNGGTDREFFKSNAPLRGGKCEVYEGGIRVPLVARWPGVIKAGSTSDHVSAFWDMLPTFAEVAGVEVPKSLDGISMMPMLTDQSEQPKHDYLYWEYFGRPAQAVRMGPWKAVRRYDRKTRQPLDTELYYILGDVAEEKNVADQYPGLVKTVVSIMDARTPSLFEQWNF
ncbi:arylsulfatase [bacterium]|nr:arylsulfatase [bacterium]